MKEHAVLRVVTGLLIPFILLYALYVQVHGEISPGGGFQAGVIFAAAFALYVLIYGIGKAEKIISTDLLRRLAALGVLIYAGTGLACMARGGAYLDYSVLLADRVAGQKLGIFIVELGVGVTVFAVMLLLFYVFVKRKA